MTVLASLLIAYQLTSSTRNSSCIAWSCALGLCLVVGGNWSFSLYTGLKARTRESPFQFWHRDWCFAAAIYWNCQLRTCEASFSENRDSNVLVLSYTCATRSLNSLSALLKATLCCFVKKAEHFRAARDQIFTFERSRPRGSFTITLS